MTNANDEEGKLILDLQDRIASKLNDLGYANDESARTAARLGEPVNAAINADSASVVTATASGSTVT